MSRYLLFVFLFIFASQAARADYQAELAAGYAQVDESSLDLDAYLGDVVWYSSPVAEGQGPLAEAGFLSRRSSIGYSFLREESAIPGTANPLFAIPDIDLENDNHAVKVRYVHDESGWFTSAALGIRDGSIAQGQVDTDLDGVNGSLAVGRYLADSTSVELSAILNEDDSDTVLQQQFCFANPDDCLVFQNEIKTQNKTRTVALSSHHLGKLGRFYYALDGALAHSVATINGTASLRVLNNPFPGLFPLSDSETRLDEEDADSWTASSRVSFYPTSRVAVQAAYAFGRMSDADNHTYILGLQWFVFRNLELRADYIWAHVGGPLVNTERWGLSVRGRF